MIRNRLRDHYREINKLKGTENKNDYEHKIEMAIKKLCISQKKNQRSTMNFKSPKGLFKHKKNLISKISNIPASPVLLIKLSPKGKIRSSNFSVIMVVSSLATSHSQENRKHLFC